MARADSAQLSSLVYWRTQRGITQRRLASRIGMNVSTVRRGEAGHSTFMRTARLMAKALRVEVADLMERPPKN